MQGLPWKKKICCQFFKKKSTFRVKVWNSGFNCQIFCLQWKKIVAILLDLKPMVTGKGGPDYVKDHSANENLQRNTNNNLDPPEADTFLALAILLRCMNTGKLRRYYSALLKTNIVSKAHVLHKNAWSRICWQALRSHQILYYYEYHIWFFIMN